MRQRRTMRNRRSMLKLLGLAAVGATAGVITGRVIDVADQDRAGAGVDGANGNGGNGGAGLVVVQRDPDVADGTGRAARPRSAPGDHRPG